MDFIISPAHAQAASIGGFDFMSLAPLVLIFVVFYFFLIRPQQKKAQEQKNLLSALRRGDRIVTTGGLIGVIHKVVNDQELQVEIADGVRVRVLRSMVATVLSGTEPVASNADESTAPVQEKPAVKKAGRPKKAVK